MSAHDVVGRTFLGGDSAIYRCIRWTRGAGYGMRLIEADTIAVGNHVIGDVVVVGEFTIGIWYTVIQARAAKAHEAPCNCWVCERRSPTTAP